MSHYIYVIGTVQADGSLGAPVKIGITSRPESRLSTIRTSCPNKIDFVHVFQVRKKEAAVWLERDAHALYERDWLSGEWFDIHPDEALESIANDLEQGIIAYAARDGEDSEFIKEKMVWTRAADALRQVTERRYIAAWESQAA